MPTYTFDAGRLGPVQVDVTDHGAGPAFLLLHGGAGPQSVAGFGEMLAGAHRNYSRLLTYLSVQGKLRPADPTLQRREPVKHSPRRLH